MLHLQSVSIQLFYNIHDFWTWGCIYTFAILNSGICCFSVMLNGVWLICFYTEKCHLWPCQSPALYYDLSKGASVTFLTLSAALTLCQWTSVGMDHFQKCFLVHQQLLGGQKGQQDLSAFMSMFQLFWKVSRLLSHKFKPQGWQKCLQPNQLRLTQIVR